MMFDETGTRPSRESAAAGAGGSDSPQPEKVSGTMDVTKELTLRVQAIGYLAETIRSFELRALDGTALPAAEPGAHIDLALPGGLSRSYSLVNAGSSTDRYVIAVNRDPKSRGGSAYMCETLRVGDLFKVSAPRNNFPLDEKAPASVLIAGGIGITPIMSMIERLEVLGRAWQLFYAIRDRAHAAFLDELSRYEAAKAGRVHIHDDSKAGRLADVAAIVAAQPTAAELYCCGPAAMIDTFLRAAEGRNPERVHVERFAGTDARPSGAFKIVLARSKRELTVPEGKTIIDILMAEGIRVAHSCRSGVCGTCETRVLEGIPDHKDNVLSARERASNKVVMICCSGAKSDKLVLDL